MAKALIKSRLFALFDKYRHSKCHAVVFLFRLTAFLALPR